MNNYLLTYELNKNKHVCFLSGETKKEALEKYKKIMPAGICIFSRASMEINKLSDVDAIEFPNKVRLCASALKDSAHAFWWISKDVDYIWNELTDGIGIAEKSNEEKEKTLLQAAIAFAEMKNNFLFVEQNMKDVYDAIDMHLYKLEH